MGLTDEGCEKKNLRRDAILILQMLAASRHAEKLATHVAINFINTGIDQDLKENTILFYKSRRTAVTTG